MSDLYTISKSTKSYYVGATCGALEDCLRRHNSNHRGYTGKASDWQIVFSRESPLRKEAMALERKIKKRGAKRFLQSLKK